MVAVYDVVIPSSRRKYRDTKIEVEFTCFKTSEIER